MSETGLVICDRRGNVEERAVSTSTSLAPTDWLIEAFGGVISESGVAITLELAMTVDTLFKAVGLISTDMAKRPLNLYQISDGKKRLATEHPAYWLMRHKPNRGQRAFDYKQQLTIHKLLTGASFAYKVYQGGRVVEVLPLLPETVTVRNTRRGKEYDVVLYFADEYGREYTEQYTFDESRIVHETWLSYDGIHGYGVMKTAKQLLGRIIAMRRYGTSVFKNSARPATVVALQTALTEAAREKFVQSWERMYSGTENAHKTAVLPPGATIQTLASTARDSQLDEQEERSIKQMANHFLMPASKLNSAIAAGYKSLEQDDLQYQNDCLHGHQVSFEDACNHAFLTEQEIKDGYFFEFDQARFRTADLTSLGNFFSKALGNNAAFMTPNDVRQEFGLNPIEHGDELPNTDAAQPNDPNSQTPDPAMTDPSTPDPEMLDSMRAAMRDAVQRAATRLVNKAKRAYKEGGEVGALSVVDCRADEATSNTLRPMARALQLAAGGEHSYAEPLATHLFAAVRAAAKDGPDSFEKNLSELTADIAERLVK